MSKIPPERIDPLFQLWEFLFQTFKFCCTHSKIVNVPELNVYSGELPKVQIPLVRERDLIPLPPTQPVAYPLVFASERPLIRVRLHDHIPASVKYRG